MNGKLSFCIFENDDNENMTVAMLLQCSASKMRSIFKLWLQWMMCRLQTDLVSAHHLTPSTWLVWHTHDALVLWQRMIDWLFCTLCSTWLKLLLIQNDQQCCLCKPPLPIVQRWGRGCAMFTKIWPSKRRWQKFVFALLESSEKTWNSPLLEKAVLNAVTAVRWQQWQLPMQQKNHVRTLLGCVATMMKMTGKGGKKDWSDHHCDGWGWWRWQGWLKWTMLWPSPQQRQQRRKKGKKTARKVQTPGCFSDKEWSVTTNLTTTRMNLVKFCGTM